MKQGFPESKQSRFQLYFPPIIDCFQEHLLQTYSNAPIRDCELPAIADEGLNAFTPTEWMPVSPLFSPRKKNSHKYDFGHVLIIGGNQGMPGAVHLAAHAAFRCGAGLVTAALHPRYSGQALSGLPELMVQGIENSAQLIPFLKKADVCVIGPGLGTDAWAEALFKETLATDLPLIIDGGALRLLAAKPQKRENWILTPHPGEAGELLGISSKTVQADRCQALQLLRNTYSGYPILKGCGTLSHDGNKVHICLQGNPGMATAGMGDLLCGVLAALIAQGIPLAQAAPAGVWLHASAGDDAALQHGPRGLMASDLLPFLQKRVNDL